jgi:hypothetical protein
LILTFVFVLVAVCPQVSADSAPTKGRTVLMVDEHDILYRSGTQRFLQQAKRVFPDTAMIPMDKPWEKGIGWTSCYRDPKSGKYQLWYQSFNGRSGDKTMDCVVSYAESDDGLKWTKPELGLFPIKEYTNTNIVLIGSGGYGDRYCCSVIVEPDDPDPAKRYTMFYYDFITENGREESAVCLAFSPDGIKWTKQPGMLYRTAFGTRGIQPPYVDEDPYVETKDKDGKVTRKSWSYPLTLSDAVDCFRDPVTKEYVIIAKMWMDSPIGGTSWKHGIGRSISKDLVNWSKPQMILYPDEHDTNEQEFHTMPVFPYNGMYFGLCQKWVRRPVKLTVDVELMTSRDGIKFERLYRNPPFIQRPEPGIYDSRSVFTNATPIILEDEIRFYYGAANMVPLLKGVKAERTQLSGVGLATIPRDRFAGIRPVDKSEQITLVGGPLEKIGQVTLKPLDLTGVTAISVNADASHGAVRLELLNEDGYRVRGYSRDDSVPMKGDSLRHAAAWNGKSLSDLPAGKYMIRVHLDNASLFAVSFK